MGLALLTQAGEQFHAHAKALPSHSRLVATAWRCSSWNDRAPISLGWLRKERRVQDGRLTCSLHALIVLRINSKHVVFGNGDLAFSDGGGGRALEEQ